MIVMTSLTIQRISPMNLIRFCCHFQPPFMAYYCYQRWLCKMKRCLGLLKSCFLGVVVLSTRQNLKTGIATWLFFFVMGHLFYLNVIDRQIFCKYPWDSLGKWYIRLGKPELTWHIQKQTLRTSAQIHIHTASVSQHTILPELWL